MDDLQSTEAGQLGVMRAHAAIFAAVVLIAAGIAGLVLAEAAVLPAWLPLAVIAALLVYPVLFAPARLARFGLARGEDELIVRRGVLTEVTTIVPFERVQHLDVAQGPIERGYGVCRLQLHTAGTAHSLVTLPGLTRETAERLRDDIRARIGRGE